MFDVRLKLSDCMEISNHGHILYFYENLEAYIDNAVSYITSGIAYGHHMIVIENHDLFPAIRLKLRDRLSGDNCQTFVHHVDNMEFYGTHGDFHCSTIVKHFDELLRPFIANGLTLRTWAHVQWREQDDIYKKLDDFEHKADASVNGAQLMSVCAYDGNSVPASLLTKTLHTHEYYMTDEELVKSPLYQKNQISILA